MRVLSLALYAAVFRCLLLPEADAEGCNCKKMSLSGPVVCDADNFQYASPCVAECQGVAAVPCSTGGGDITVTRAAGAPPVLLSGKYTDTHGTVGAAELSRFKDEGFKLCGKVKLVRGNPVMPRVARSSGSSSKMAPAGAAVPGSIYAVRVTREGLLYAQSPAATAAAIARLGKGRTGFQGRPGTLVRSANATTRDGHRKLLVFGADNRKEVQAHKWPFTAVGHLVGTPYAGSGYVYSCSGALVGPYTVLTAGHCVYDEVNNQWYSSVDFYPARHGGQDHADDIYTWETVDTYWHHAYGMCSRMGCELGAFNYDFAVIQLSNPAGDTYGTLGLTYNCGSREYSVTSAGYPGDKEWGTMWRTTGKLDRFQGCANFVGLTSGVVSSNLDVSQGQSGSAVWDAEKYVRALVNAVGSTGKAYHRTITKFVFQFVVGRLP